MREAAADLLTQAALGGWRKTLQCRTAQCFPSLGRQMLLSHCSEGVGPQLTAQHCSRPCPSKT